MLSLPWRRKALERVKGQLFVFLSSHWAFQLARECMHDGRNFCWSNDIHSLLSHTYLLWGGMRSSSLQSGKFPSNLWDSSVWGHLMVMLSGPWHPQWGFSPQNKFPNLTIGSSNTCANSTLNISTLREELWPSPGDKGEVLSRSLTSFKLWDYSGWRRMMDDKGEHQSRREEGQVGCMLDKEFQELLCCWGLLANPSLWSSKQVSIPTVHDSGYFSSPLLNPSY